MPPEAPRRVLIVQTAYLGDVILATPLIRAAHHLWPRAEIDFLCIPQTSSLLAGNPLVHEIVVYDKRGRERGPRALARLVRRLRLRGYDLALVPHRSMRSAWLVRLAGVPLRVGFDRSAGKYLFTHIVRYRRDRHEVERNLDLLSPFGSVREPCNPELHPSEKDTALVDELLGPLGNGEFVALAPGSVWPTKRWPAAHYGQLAALLRRRVGLPSVVIGGDADVPTCQQVVEHSNGAATTVAGKLTPLQSAEVVRRAALLVTNDTAPLHMSSAMGTPVVAVFGPTVPELGFGPYGVPHRIASLDLPCRPCSEHGGKSCPIGTFQCMLDLRPDKVVQLVQDLLEEVTGKQRRTN